MNSAFLLTIIRLHRNVKFTSSIGCANKKSISGTYYKIVEDTFTSAGGYRYFLMVIYDFVHKLTTLLLFPLAMPRVWHAMLIAALFRLHKSVVAWIVVVQQIT